MRRWRAVTAVVAGTVLLLSGCGGAASEPKAGRTKDGPYPMTISDCGREVEVPKRPSRVLTVGARSSTLVWAAGGSRWIIARATERGVPLALARKKLRARQLTPYTLPSAAQILDRRPDLVISDGLPERTAQRLAMAGVPSLVKRNSCPADVGAQTANPVSTTSDAFDDVMSDIRRYARVLRTDATARVKRRDLRLRIATVKNTSDFTLDSAAAVTVRGDWLSAYGRPSMANAQLETMGMTNVFGDLEARRARITADELAAADPEVIVVMSTGPGPPRRSADRAERDLRALPGAKQLSAVEHNRIVTLELPFMTASPLAVDGLETMAASVEAMQ